MTSSVGLDQTVYIGSARSRSTVLVSGVGKLCAGDDFSGRHFRCIFDGNGHEKNIPRHVAI